MDTFVVTSFFVLEVIAVSLVVDLWLRRRMNIFLRIFWSFLLPIPLIGLLLFAFIVSSPDYNPDKADPGFGSSEAGTGGDGHGLI